MKYKQTLCTVTASILLASCATSTKPSPAQPSPLVIANCPALAPLNDDSFGATVLKLIDVANQYRDCRDAALAK